MLSVDIFEALKQKTVVIPKMSLSEFLFSKDFIVMLTAFGLSFYFVKDALKSAVLMVVFYLAYIIVPLTVKESFDLIYPEPNSSPNCLKITQVDLLAHFENNETKLKQSMVESHVPHSVELNDTNAPYIATYLVNNKNINSIGDCRLIV